MPSLRRTALCAASLATLPGLALAFHDVDAGVSQAPGWTLDPWLLAALGTSALLYGVGVRALWRSAGAGRGLRRGHVARFATGWLVLSAALVSPLDAASASSFALHMVQHELLMVVAAPLLVLGRPLEAWAWGLPAGLLRALAPVARSRSARHLWRWLTEPLGAWLVHALVLWTWHVPALFTAALASQPLHVLQHASFFASALAFWWSVLGRGARAPDATSLASVFTTMLHTGLLGALLTFAPTAWYATGPGLPGLSALEDQQLGGLVMWVPGGLAYLAAGLAIAATLLRSPSPPPRLRTAD